MTELELMRSRALADLAEGVMALGFDGVVQLVNDAALEILGKPREALVGLPFARCFFDEPENDAFCQCVLDAVYDKTRRQERYVPYTVGGQVKQLRVLSSFLRDGDETVGVVLVLSDITELTELQDAVRAMERIQALNGQLELRNQLLQETFGRYLSDDIVKEILEKPEGLRMGGQKRELTIMMSDLRGFTMLCRDMAPTDLISMLNHYFSEMYEPIRARGGTLIEFLGDGMFVIFGAPILRETHAADAVAAAVEMQQRMDAVNAWNAERGYPHLAMGIGINTDTVVLGNIGSEKRTKYGVIGAAVNLTGRLESYTTEGQIVISPTTRAAIPAPLDIEAEFDAAPKGVEGSITVTAVRGIGGEYGVHLADAQAAPPRALAAPVEVGFRVLEGKHVEGGLLRGAVTALSEDRACMETDAAVAVFDNLCLDVVGGLYAKVTDKQGAAVTLRFTAKPEGFDAWRKGCVGG